MSILAAKLQPRLPEGFDIPEPLLRAWAWMEAQGWGFENASGDYFLTPYAGERQIGIVFSTDASLAGWFEPEDDGFNRLVPFAELDGSGSTGALWRAAGGEIQVVGLGSEGAVSTLATSALDFLRLVAVGYVEIDHRITEEPDDEDAQDAHAPFRTWLQGEFGVDVPEAWMLPQPDSFNKWVCGIKGEDYGTY